MGGNGGHSSSLQRLFLNSVSNCSHLPPQCPRNPVSESPFYHSVCDLASVPLPSQHLPWWSEISFLLKLINVERKKERTRESGSVAILCNFGLTLSAENCKSGAVLLLEGEQLNMHTNQDKAITLVNWSEYLCLRGQKALWWLASGPAVTQKVSIQFIDGGFINSGTVTLCKVNGFDLNHSVTGLFLL